MNKVITDKEEIRKELSKDNPLAAQEGGTHYKHFVIQPIEFILANKIPYTEGNIIKYICRWKYKGGLSDLRKAAHYIDMLIAKEEGTL